MIIQKIKKGQAELITTVLLILISIAAVVLVSVFIINMVRTNLVSTDCFKTANQFKINLNEGYTYYNTTTGGKAVYISISRGEEAINISGIMISIGTGQSSISYTIRQGSSEPSGVNLWNGSAPILPGKSETRTYKISSSELVSKVKIVPILEPDRTCKEGSDEQTIPSKT